MKSFICIFVCVMCFFLCTSHALAQNQEEEAPTTPRIDVSGFVFLNLVYDENFKRGWNRVRIQLNDNKSPWGFRLEVEGQKFDRDQPWIQQARIEYRATDRTTISFGRQFLGAVYLTYAPISIMTVRYPSAYPFGVFGYGIQIEHQLNKEWMFWGDITGNSDKSPFQKGNFERVESSAYLGRNTDSFSYGFGVQVSRDFKRTGANLGWSGSWIDVSGALIIGNNTEKSNTTSGVIHTMFVKYDFLRPHIQLVRSPKGDTIWTGGLGIIFGKHCKVIIDIEHSDDETVVVGRSQLTFIF